MSNELEGRTIVVTRPVNQAEGLCKLIEVHGGTAFRFPTQQILPPEDSGEIDEALMDFPETDIALFVSPNAVEYTMLLAEAHDELLEGPVFGAVGRTTKKALEAHGIEVAILPEERFDSEGMLATPELNDVEGKTITIFRGNSGRELLAETLEARGAEVSYVECYRRVKPKSDPSELLEKLNSGEIDTITVTSGEGLENLVEMAGDEGRDALTKTELTVVSPRIAEIAKELGFASITTAEGAADERVLISLVNAG